MLLEHLRLGHASDGLGSEVEGRILQRLVAHIELWNLHRKLTVGLVRLVHHVGVIALDLLQRLVVLLPVGLSLRFDRRRERQLEARDIFIVGVRDIFLEIPLQKLGGQILQKGGFLLRYDRLSIDSGFPALLLIAGNVALLEEWMIRI